MARYRLIVEYDGAPYFGFQAQKDQPSVQASLMRAIEAFCGEQVVIHAAGRTDSGVHATGQVIHFDTTRDWPAETVRNAINAHLASEPIAVLDAQFTDMDFHARFSAKGRRYLYRILNRRAPPALDRGRVWHVKTELDAAAMHAAAQRLIGLHDFTTFRDANCQSKSPVKTLDVARVWREGEEVRLAFEAPLVPAPPGALHDRLAGGGGPGPLERRRSGGRAQGRRPLSLRPGRPAAGALSRRGGVLAIPSLPGRVRRPSFKATELRRAMLRSP